MNPVSLHLPGWQVKGFSAEFISFAFTTDPRNAAVHLGATHRVKEAASTQFPGISTSNLQPNLTHKGAQIVLVFTHLLQLQIIP